jgi:hypothetical protein
MHSYLLLVSSSKGSFGEESLGIGSLRCIVVIWEEGGGRKEGLSKVYGGGNNSGKPSRQDSMGAFRDNGAIGKGVTYRPGRSGAVIGCLHVCHF